MASESSASAAKGAAGAGSHPVYLRVYDLSRGMAKQMSMSFLGKQVDGIWHTGILVHGREYFFGGGIQALPTAIVESSFGIKPVQVLLLGHTSVDEATLMDYIRGISPRFTQATYNLFTHNCNNFSNEVSQFLLGKGIPAHIINLPNEVLSTPLGQMLAPMITQMQDSMYGNAHTQGDAVDPFTALAGSAAAASAPAAAAAPAPAPAPATVAAVPASHELETAARPLVSTDTSVLKVVIDRLLKRGALVPEEESVARAAVARLAAGTVSSDGKTEEGGSDADTKAFTSVLRRIIVATNNTAGPALCLLRSAVLDGGFLGDLIAEPDALRTVISNLASQVYTTVTPRLMALATLSNLFATSAGATFMITSEGLLSQAIDAGLGALASDNRVQVRQLGAALLHNTVLKLDPLVEGRLSDDLGLVLCSLCESVDDADEEATRRRLLAIGRLVSRAGDAAGELVYAAELLPSIEGITTNGAYSEALRALAAEVVALAKAHGATGDE